MMWGSEYDETADFTCPACDFKWYRKPGHTEDEVILTCPCCKHAWVDPNWEPR